MPLLKITNRTQTMLNFGGQIGSVAPYQTRSVQLTATQLEQHASVIQALLGKSGIDLVIQDDPSVDNRVEVATLSSVTGTVSGVTTMYVAAYGSDTTGDGSFTAPFKSCRRAASELAKYTQPKGNPKFNVLRICIIPSPTYAFNWNGGTPGTANLFTDDYIWNIQPHLPPHSAGYRTNAILVDAYTSPETMGTTSDARFTALLSNLAPTAVATENGRPRYTFALGTLASSFQYIGHTVRVFDSLGVEKWRGSVAFDRANVGGVDQLVIQPSYMDATPMSTTDRIMICKPSVTIADYLQIDGSPSCNVIFAGIGFSADFASTTILAEGSYGIHFYGCMHFGEQALGVYGGVVHYGSPRFAPDGYDPLSAVYPVGELALWSGWVGGIVAPTYAHRSTLVSGAGQLYLSSVVKGTINSWDAATVVSFDDAVVVHGGVILYGGELRTSQTFMGRANVFAHATNAILGSGTLTTGSDPLMIDAATVSGDAVVLTRCKMDGNTSSIVLAPMDAGVATLTGGKALNVIDMSHVLVKSSTSTLHGTAGTDVTVGSTSYTYAALTSAGYVSDTTRGCVVKAS